MSHVNQQLSKWESLALLARDKCMIQMDYNLTKSESFAIAVLSNVPYKSEYDPVTSIMKYQLDPCSVVWDPMTEKFIVATKGK